MKYFTKKWYDSMQKMHCPPLKINDEVSSCDEKLFDKLYKQKENDYLKKKGPYFKENFRELYEMNLETLKNKLPHYILNNISDIRLLAIGYATKENYEKIKAFFENNERYVDKMVKDYEKEIENQFEDNKPPFLYELFHDCFITEGIIREKDLIFKIDNEGEFTDVSLLIFKNAKIIKQECDFENSWWLYEELYKKYDGYELHILVRNDGLKEIIIECSDIILER